MPANYDGSEEVADLRSEVSQLKQELRTHRKVLEECLQVRQGLADLLAHREVLTQVFELREGAQQSGQSMVVSERLDRIEIRIMEGLEHQGELDLSLAGVSENTAKQGMAISALMDQQKCTAATLDAVVRAVKRLDRSRSRPRGLATETLSAGRYAEGSVYTGDMEQSERGAVAYNGRYPPPGSVSNGSVHASARGGDPDLGGDAGGSECPVHQDDACDEQMQEQSQDRAEAHQEDVEPEGTAWSDVEPEGTADIGRYSSTGGSDAWNWRGWGRERNDQDESRYASASSSCGSDGRFRHRGGARPRAASARRHRHGGSFPYVYPRAIQMRSLSGHADPGVDHWMGQVEHDFSASGRSRSIGSAGGHAAHSAEGAHCAKGVLARIEAALTKLDVPPGHCNGHAGRASARGGYCRPHSAATPRGKSSADAATRAYGGGTPRRRHQGGVSQQ